MTDINLDTVELKKAEFTANVGDKQITAKVADKTEADKATDAIEKGVTYPSVA